MISATYFDGRSSSGNEVEVELGRGLVRVIGLEDVIEVPLQDVEISEALGRTRRTITFNNGARLDMPDCPQLDQYRPQDSFYWAHFLESHWHYVVAAIALVVAITWISIVVGIPIAARRVAYLTPESVDETVGEQGLSILDRAVLTPSALEQGQQQALLDLFEPITRYAADEHRFRLEIRTGGAFGANAFALPSGIVIITDELVELAENNEELVGILAHEVGHIVNRHSMRLLLQSSATAMLVATLTGDLASLSALAASVPTVLVQTSYSRDFEREADAYALSYLEHVGIPTQHFGNILQRLEALVGGQPDGVMGYLSTHPAASDRAGDES